MASGLFRLAVWAALVGAALNCTAGQASSGTQAAEAPKHFISVHGDQLMDGDRPYRFISFNIPNLLVVEDAFEFTRPNPWRWPDEFEIEDALESVRQMGGQVVRTYVITVRRAGSDMGDTVHVRGPGEFNEQAFRTLDKVIEIARRKGLRVIVPFVDQHKWMGGIGEYAAFRGKPAEAFWTDRQIIEDFEATIRYLIQRKNTYTGVAYRDEPAIFGWETGNEIDATPEWTRRIAATIKKLDPNHVVIDGRSLDGVPVESLDDPNVDVITTHHYPWADNDFATPMRAAHALTKGKKPYFVGEFGFIETPNMEKAIDAIIDDGISGGLLWSLRFHRREGGFYWHMEVGTGGNRYKAYHWPGFASGKDYDERAVLAMVREAAFRIQGRETPPLEKPAAPKLLPIRRVSEISWQGSAGAASYDVWRAPRADGPWEKIADGVSDADVQYRPLLDDATAVPGESYFYRIVARNEAGESGPSNVVGPVAVECRTLVDECRDLSLVASTEGDVKLSTEVARQRQEDSLRLALPAGGAVVYRVDGSISAFRIFAFASDEDAELEVAISSDGKQFEPVERDRWTFPSPQSVYGYLTPVLVEGEVTSNGARYVRIAAVGEPLELSRVEIEFDRVPRDAARHAPAAVSPTVYVDDVQRLPATLATIDKAAEQGDRRLNVCVTIYVDLTKDLKVKSFGTFQWSGRRYEPFDAAKHERLKQALGQVFRRMVEHGMDINILPHIDAGGEVEAWRNWADFDPTVKYGGFSYEELMIEPIAEALAETVTPETQVELALSGEMGTSLFRYPQSYRAIIERLRERSAPARLAIGVSVNHGGIAGDGNPAGIEDIQLGDAARRELQQVIDGCDFVGLSFYRPVRVETTADDFVHGIEHTMGEFERHGLTVPVGKPLQFSEVGIGGGGEDGEATDPETAAAAPWTGSGNPWRDPSMQSLRRQYHRAMLEFLAEQPAERPVTAAFFWSTGSWDPQGLRHPVFADLQIAAAVGRHNRAVEGGRKRQPPGDSPGAK